VDFLFVLIELFSLGVTIQMLWANTDWKSAFRRGGSVSINIFT